MYKFLSLKAYLPRSMKQLNFLTIPHLLHVNTEKLRKSEEPKKRIVKYDTSKGAKLI